MSGKKRISRAKLKAANQEERLYKRKEHFKNLLANPPEITNKQIQKIINGKLKIKLMQFTEEQFDAVLNKIKNRKAAGLNKMPSEVWKTRKFDYILLWLCNAVYKQNTIEKWMKGCILPLPQERQPWNQ